MYKNRQLQFFKHLTPCRPVSHQQQYLDDVNRQRDGGSVDYPNLLALL